MTANHYATGPAAGGVRDDGGLVARALGDRLAYGLIVGRYEAPLRRYVGRVLGSESQAAEDVLQEAFLKAYVNLNDYDQRRPFAPWLYRIAHNEAVSHLRRTHARPRPIGGDDGALILARLSDGVDWGERLTSFDDVRLVQAALAELAPRYRDVLVLRYLEDKNYDEISDILRLPPGTVATLIRRGADRLRTMLAASAPNAQGGT